MRGGARVVFPAHSGATYSAFAAAQIFLRAGQMAALDKLRTELLNRSAVTLQRHARGFVLRRRYARARRAALTLQARPPARSHRDPLICAAQICCFFFRG